MQSDHLIIFVKAPKPGEVKTRLAKDVGDAAACAAYCRIAQRLFEQLAALPEVELRFSPDHAREQVEPWLRPSWHLRPQGRGDLGQRLTAAFAEAFAGGAQRVVISGSDCPAVTRQDIESAWTKLRSHDLVLGPARDGGYWLIGLRQPEPSLFAGVHWSTETVLRETLQRAQSAGLSVKLLRELTDVDTESDWREFLAADQAGDCGGAQP